MNRDMNQETIAPGFMRQRQAVLKESYREAPERAMVTDWAQTSSVEVPADNPLASHLTVDKHNPTAVRMGVHTALGGRSDAPTPGDLLCGALAACLDSTIRIIFNNFGVVLSHLSVTVTGQVDVRGTLLVERSVPVGFQRFEARVEVATVHPLPGGQLEQIIQGAERSCVVLQTLSASCEISVTVFQPPEMVA